MGLSGKQALEYAPRHPHHPRYSPISSPELHGLPLGVPTGVLGEGRLGNGAPRAILLIGAADEEHAPREGLGEMTDGRSAQLLRREVIE